MKSFGALLLIVIPLTVPLGAQSTGATFGKVIRLDGTPSDVVLDESRGYLYAVNSNANRVDVVDRRSSTVVRQIPVGTRPLAAALSMDASTLYVSNNGNASISIINLSTFQVSQTINVPAAPEGVEVAADGRVLISTEGTGSTDSIQSLYVFDASQQQGQQMVAVTFPPPAATPSTLPAVTAGRAVTQFRGKLVRTPDGNYIIGLSTVNNNTQTVLFVYEAASGVILRSRTVTGQSTVLSLSPDGSRFMAGFTLYDTATLAVIAQQNTANVPFPLVASGTASFSTLQNIGGSTFSADGETLYSAFNTAPFSQPATRTQASTLLISNSHHLGVRLGIKIPESIIAKMVISADGTDAWGISESGLLYLPLSTLYDYPILQPETTTVFLASDDCNRGLSRAAIRVLNLGKGKLTFSVPDTTAALAYELASAVVPSAITFVMEPGRTGVTRRPGTNLYTGTVSNGGTALSLNLASPEAINIPNTIKVFMNYRQSDQRGVVYPIPTSPTASEGLQDILVDETRGKVYIANSGYNRIEVFDIAKQRLTAPIEAGQLPRQMALSFDNSTLYVANAGGESIVAIDLETQSVISSIKFPAIPRSGNAAPVTPQAIGLGLSGLQFLMSDGSQWKVTGTDAMPRPTNLVTPTQLATSTAQGPPRLITVPGGRSMAALSGNATAYLYDAMADTYTLSSRIYNSATIQGYFGPMAAGPFGSYYMINGLILNASLSLLGGSESTTSTNNSLFSTKRNVAAVAAVDENRMLRLTTQPRQSATATTGTGDSRSTLELLDLRDGSISLVGATAENPAQSVFGTARTNISPRQMAVDSAGNVYLITLSGLSVIPMQVNGVGRPQLTASRGVINATDGSTVFKPGAFVQLSGTNLALPANAEEAPQPVLGGSCVVLSDMPLRLLQTSRSQILAQIPENLAPGMYVLQIRSLSYAQQSDASVITVTRP